MDHASHFLRRRFPALALPCLLGIAGPTSARAQAKQAKTPPAGTTPAPGKTPAQVTPTKPATVLVGAYVMSLYDLNPANNTFTSEFWLWFVHDKTADLKPLKTIEPENARSFATSLDATEDHGAVKYHAEKVRGVFNYNWDVANFPFDRHELAVRISEGQDEADKVVYAPDSVNVGVDPLLRVDGWHIENVHVATGVRHFSTNFGEPGQTGGSNYAQAVLTVTIARDAMGLFWKLHSPVYIAFLIGLISFFMGTSKDSTFAGRLSLVVGMVFAVVVNTARVQAILGTSPAFTLPDKIHVITLLALLACIGGALVSRHFHGREKGELALRIDRTTGFALLAVFVVINVAMVGLASRNG